MPSLLKGRLLTLTIPASAADPKDQALSRLADLVADDMARVEALIADRMQSPVGRIPLVANHLIGAGGKRLRPMLTIAAANLFGYAGDHHLNLAATVEFIHTATLLHDDVVDGSALRRGRSSANIMFGSASSVLVGDFLFARAFHLMVETGSLRVLDILSAASQVIVEGEVRQLAAANDVDTDVATYLQIIDAKTAALFAAAAQVGAVLAERSADEEAAMRTYGRELGLAFQLVDDALDYGGAPARLGKNVGDDFREGKVTMPVVVALAQATPDERAFWTRVVGGEQSEGDFAHALELMKRRNALVETVEAARRHSDAARAALADVPAGPIRTALEDLTRFVVERAY